MTTATRTRAKLTVRQRAFAEALAQGNSQREAGELAGYANHDGTLVRTARLPAVKEYIEQRINKARKSEEWSVEWWRQELASLLADAATAGDLAIRARSLELAGKHIGAFEPSPDSGTADRAAEVLLALGRLMSRDRAVSPLPQPVDVRAGVYRVLSGGAEESDGGAGDP